MSDITLQRHPDGQLTAGVIGWPVAHSKSPMLHRFWLEALGLDGDYVRLPVAPPRLHTVLKALPALGLAGVNITVPHKLIALKLADHVDLSALLIGSANTVVVADNGQTYAFNTDHAGFREPLDRRGITPASAVVIGAGGAARAVAWALDQMGVEQISFVNRSAAPARELAQICTDKGKRADVLELTPGMILPPADLVVNSSSLGMKGQPPLDVRLDSQRAGSLVYDLVYAPLETPLLAQARARGLPTIDGLDMLIGQAGAAFQMFYDADPPRHRDADLRTCLTSPSRSPSVAFGSGEGLGWDPSANAPGHA